MTDLKDTKHSRVGRRPPSSKKVKQVERTRAGPQRASQASGSKKPLPRTQAADQPSGSRADGVASSRTPPGAADVATPPARATTRPEPAAGAEPVEPVFLTLAEVARLLRMSERTIRRRIKDGTIRKAPVSGRLVRIAAEELTRLAERNISPKPSEDQS